MTKDETKKTTAKKKDDRSSRVDEARDQYLRAAMVQANRSATAMECIQSSASIMAGNAALLTDHTKHLFHVADGVFKCGIGLYEANKALRSIDNKLAGATTAIVVLAVEGFFVAVAAVAVLVALVVG